MIKKIIRESFTLAILMLAIPLVFGENFLPLEEINRGMKGTGITRWNNNMVKEFDLEIVGVLRNNPNSGVIIAKINDEEIKNTGVVAGMSGSPVYVNNKIIGAIAFTWRFLKEPFVGITPIEDIFLLQNYNLVNKSYPNDINYVTPILLSGVSSFTKELLESKLKNKNILFVDSFSKFSTIKSNFTTNTFKPGDSIGISLVSGDMEITAIGTVTYVDGDKVFGLGHPAFLSGKTSIPISDIEIIAIIPKQDLSFKIGVPKNIIGSLEFDGSSGIFAIVGKEAPTIKVSVNVDNKNFYKYSIAKDPTISQYLTSAVITESILRTKGISGEGNVELSCSVSFNFEGSERELILSFKDIIPVYNLGAGYSLSTSDVLSILDFLLYNPLFKVNINKIHVNINTKSLDVGFITFVIPSKTVVSPNEEIKITVGIKKIRDNVITKDFYVKIPPWVNSGTKINIGVMNKASRTIQKLNNFPESIVFDTYEKLYNFISEDLRVDKMVLYMEIPGVSYASGGYVYNLLPNYLSTIFSVSPKSKNLMPFIIEEESWEDFPIGGIATTTIFVK
ncbi:MAG: SpoIVB peptidase S55 domain-containing protein [Brevinematia bacterium]